MHELSVCQSLLDQVDSLARAQQASRVLTITVRCGPLSGIEPHLLKQAFSIARAASLAPQAELVVELDPLIVWCNDCDREQRVSPNRFRCPDCGRSCSHLVSGDALILASIEIERPASPLQAHQATTKGENRHV